MINDQVSIALDSTVPNKNLALSNGIAEICERIGHYIGLVINHICLYLSYAAGIIVILMVAGIVVDVASRVFFNKPLNGMLELQTFAVVIVAFTSLAYAMINNKHVRIDFIFRKFPQIIKNALEVIYSIWGLFLFSMISYQIVLRMINAFTTGDTADLTGIPLYIIYGIVSIGFILMCGFYVSNMLTNTASLLRKSSHPYRYLIYSLIISFGFLAFPIAMNKLLPQIDPMIAGVIAICVLLIIMMLGFHIAFAIALIGVLGLFYISNIQMAFDVLYINAYDSMANYLYAVLVFFVLMGAIALKSGIGERLYRTAAVWTNRLPGGLCIATILGSAGFGAICGSSMACAATIGSLSIPEMRKAKYNESLFTGALAAGGTIGILIPPSGVFVIYGMITEQSIGKLFMAGLVPGILSTILFAIYIFLRCKMKPSLAPKNLDANLPSKAKSLLDVWPVIVLFLLIMGGIYSGIATPTEAGGLGVAALLLINIFQKTLSWKTFFSSLTETTQMSCWLLIFMMSVSILGYFFSLTKVPIDTASFIASLEMSRWFIFVIILLMYLFLGMILNIIPMMMLTLPILFPTIMALGFDPIWFGVIMVTLTRIGQITPPIGINVFVISGIAKDIELAKIFAGVTPFVILMLLLILLLVLVPDLSLYLPEQMDVLQSIDSID